MMKWMQDSETRFATVMMDQAKQLQVQMTTETPEVQPISRLGSPGSWTRHLPYSRNNADR